MAIVATIFSIILALNFVSERTSAQEAFPSQLAITVAPFSVYGRIQGGVSFGPTVVEFRDSNFSTVSVNDGRLIKAALVSENFASLRGTTVLRMGVDSRDGIAVFSDLIIDKVCVLCKLQFTSGSLFIISEGFQTIQGPPSRIIFVGFPGYGVAGLDLSPPPAIQVLDAGSNLVTAMFNASVIKLSGYGDLLSRTNQFFTFPNQENNYSAVFYGLFISTANALVDPSLLQPGQSTAPYYLNFIAKFGNSSGTNSSVTLSAVAPGLIITERVTKASLSVPLAQSSAAAVPLPIQPIILLFDNLNGLVVSDADAHSITATLFGGTPGANILGTVSVVSSGGRAAYTNLAVDKVGMGYFIQFTSDAVFPPVNSTLFNITPGLPSKLQLIIQPVSSAAGSILKPYPAIEVQDIAGNVIPSSFTISVSISGLPSFDLVLPSQPFVNSVLGIAIFKNISVQYASDGLRLRFYIDSSLTTESDPFNVFPSTPARIMIVKQPSSAVRGVPLSGQPTLQMADSFGNRVSLDRPVLVVRASIRQNAGMGTLGGNLVRRVSGGLVSFSDLSINNPANGYILRFHVNYTADGFWVDSIPFNISGVPAALVILQQPLDSYGGMLVRPEPQIAIVDSFLQYVSETSGINVSAFIYSNPESSPNVSFFGTRHSESEGFIFTDIRIDRAGSDYKIIFKASGSFWNHEITSQSFNVFVGKPYSALFLVQPSLSIAARPMSPASVGTVDLGGNLAGFDGSVQVDVKNASQLLVSSFTVTAKNGLANLSHVFYSAGTFFQMSVSITVPGLPAPIFVLSQSFEVIIGDLHELFLIAQPGSSVQNQPLSRDPIVALRDAGENLVVSYLLPVSVSRAFGPSSAYVIGNLSVLPVSGLVRFEKLSISDVAKSYSLRFTALSLDKRHSVSLDSEGFSVTHPAEALVVKFVPLKLIAGVSFNASVSLMDKRGDVVKASLDIVSVNSSDSINHRIQGRTSISFDGGIGYFSDLVLMKAGPYVLQFVSLQFQAMTRLEVIPGNATSLKIISHPEDCVNNTVFFVSPSIQYIDDGGNSVLTSGIARVAISKNLVGSKLVGGQERNFSLGIALFDGLSIIGLGNGFTLLFTSGLFAAESRRFSVNGDLQSIALIAFPAGAVNINGNIQFTSDIQVAILDVAGNIIPGGFTRPPFVAVTAFSSSGVSLATVPVRLGVAKFTSLSLVPPVSLGGNGMRLNFRCNVSCKEIISPYFFVSPATECRLRFLQQQTKKQLAGDFLQPFPKLVIEARNPVSTMFEPMRGSAIRVEATLRDAANQLIPLSGASVLQAAAGLFSFTDLSVRQASDPVSSEYFLTFSMIPRLNAESSVCRSDLIGNRFSVQIGFAVSLRIERELDVSTNGLPFSIQPCISLKDAGGNLVQTGYSVSVSLLGNSSAILLGNSNIFSDDGIVSFTDLRISGVASTKVFRLLFSCLHLQAISLPFTVETGAPFSIAIVVQPSDSIAMVPMQMPPVVAVRDAGGTAVTGEFEVVAYLVGNSAFNPIYGSRSNIKQGTASFPELVIAHAGSGNKIRFSWHAISSPASVPFNIFIGFAAALRVGIQPAANVVGVTFSPSPTVIVIDNGGNAVFGNNIRVSVRLNFNGSVSFFNTPDTPIGLTGSTSRFAVSGRAVFSSLSISGVGRNLRLLFSCSGLSSVSSDFFNITGPPRFIDILQEPLCFGASGQSSLCVAGKPFVTQPTVQLLDFNGNYVQALDFKDGVIAQGSLNGRVTADIVQGKATFTDLSFKDAHSKSVIVFHSDFFQPGSIASTIQFDVLSGNPDRILILSQPSSSSRGLLLGQQPSTTLVDSYGNIVYWYVGSVACELWRPKVNVTFALDGSKDARFNQSRGEAKFTDLSVRESGSDYLLRFFSSGLQIDSISFVVSVGPPNRLILATPTRGAVITGDYGLFYPQPVVVMMDAGYGAVDSFSMLNCSGFCRVTAQLICCPLDLMTGVYVGATILMGNTSIVAKNGEASFTDLAINGVGRFSLRFSVGALPGVSPSLFVDQNDVYAQIPYSLALEVQPGKAVLGLPLRQQPIVKVKSSFGDVVNASVATVSASLANGSMLGCSILVGTTVVRAVWGTAIFTDLAIMKSSQNMTCRFKFISDSFVSVVSSVLFSLSYGPTQLKIVSQPSGSVVGKPLTGQPQLSLQDLTGETVTNDNGNMVSAVLVCNSSSCSSSECGFFGRKNAINIMGVMNFTDLRIDKLLRTAPSAVPDNCYIRFRLGRFTATSDAFQVMGGDITSLKLLVEPTDTHVNSIIFPAVQVLPLDPGGNRVVLPDGAVLAQLVPDSPFGASLSGIVCRSISGLAIFDSLQVSIAGPLMAIRFSVSSIAVLSQQFSIHGDVTSLQILDFPSQPIKAGFSLFPVPQIALFDIIGSLTSSLSFSRNQSISVSLIRDQNEHSVLCGKDVVASEQGVAYFDALWLQTSGDWLVARFTMVSNPSVFVDSPAFKVVAGTPSILQLLQNPSHTEAGSQIYPWPIVQILDSYGNVVLASVNVTTTLDHSNNCSSEPYLVGSSLLLSTQGIVKFANLSIVSCPGKYRLLFRLQLAANDLSMNISDSSPACGNRSILWGGGVCRQDPESACNSNTLSDFFEVYIGNPILFLSRQPGPGRAGRILSVQPTVRVSDIANNLFSGAKGHISYFFVSVILKSSGITEAVLSDDTGPCPCTVRLEHGEAAFSNLKVDIASPSLVLEFFIDSLPMPENSISSDPFPVTGSPVSLQILDTLPEQIAFDSTISVRARLVDPNSISVRSESMNLWIVLQNGTYLGQVLSHIIAGEAHFKNLQMRVLGTDMRLRFESEGMFALSSYFSVAAGNATRLSVGIVPPSIVVLNVLMPALTVTMLDAAGNIAGNANYVINATLVDSNRETLQDIDPETTYQGVATFSNLKFRSSGSSFQIRFSSILQGHLVESLSAAFNISVGKIVELRVTSQPGAGIVGKPISRQPEVMAFDGGGNPVLFFEGVITISGSSDLNMSHSIQGTLAVKALNGVASFTDITVHTRTSFAYLKFYSSNSCGLQTISERFIVTGRAASLDLTKIILPPIFGGTPFSSQPQLSVFDFSGIVVAAYSEDIHLRICGGSGKGSIHGNISIAFQAGVADFTNLAVDLVGDYTLCFQTSTLRTNITFIVGVGPAAAIKMINHFPTVIQARFDIRSSWRNLISVVDSAGNTFLPGQTPPCILTELVRDNNYSSFKSSLIVKQSQLCNNSYLPVICEPYIDPATGDFSALVSCTRAGVPYELLYEPEIVGVQWPYLSISAPVGDVKLKVSLNPSSFFVTDAFQVTSGPVQFSALVVQPGAAICNAQWSTIPMIEARDAGGNAVTSQNTMVSMKVWNALGYFPGSGWKDVSVFLSGCSPNSSFIDGVAAFAGCRIQCSQSMICAMNSFRLRFEGPGLADSANSNQLNFAEPAWSKAFTISSSPNYLKVDEMSSSAFGGAGFVMQPRISFWADHCNPSDMTSPSCFVSATDQSSFVIASILNDSLQSMLRGSTRIQVLNGWANFTDLALTKSSQVPYILVFRSGSLSVRTNVTVSTGSATALSILEEPTVITPGQGFDFKVAVQDDGGNFLRDTAISIQVAFAGNFGVFRNPLLKANSADGKLSRTVLCISDPCHASGFQLSVDKAPMIYSFVFSMLRSDGLRIVKESSRFEVRVGEVAGLRQKVQPVNVISGGMLNAIELNLVDSGGNIVYNSLLDVTVTLYPTTDGKATLTGTLASKASMGSVYFINISLTYQSDVTRSRGVHKLQYESGSVRTVSNPFFVHGPASSIRIQTGPSSKAIANSAFMQQPILEIRDLRGIRAYSENVTVTATVLASGSVVRLNGAVRTTCFNGLAAFTDLSISAVGQYQIMFSITNLPVVVTEKIVVTIGDIYELEIAEGYQPGMTMFESQMIVRTNYGGEPFVVQPKIMLLDSGRNLCTGIKGFVTAIIHSYPSARSSWDLNCLLGTVIAPVDPETATAQFTNLAINLKGLYSLSFRVGSVSVVSNEFEISVGRIAQLLFASIPDDSTFSQPFRIQPSVYLLDRGGNTVFGTPWVHLGISAGQESGSRLLGCNRQFAKLDSGLVQFSGCYIEGTVSKNHTIVASTLLTGGAVVNGILQPVDIHGSMPASQQNDFKLTLESRFFLVTGPATQIVLDKTFHWVVVNQTFQEQPSLLFTDANNVVVRTIKASISVFLVSAQNRSVNGVKGTSRIDAISGIAVFTDLSIAHVGNFFLCYASNATNVSYLFQPITVKPGEVFSWMALNFLSSAVAGNPLLQNGQSPTILSMDSNGNPTPTSLQIEIVAQCPNNHSLCLVYPEVPYFTSEGQTRAVDVINGTAVLTDLRPLKAGALHIKIFSSTLSYTIPTEITIMISAGEATNLYILTQPPAAVIVNVFFFPSPAVQVHDNFTNIVETYGKSVSVSFAWSPRFNSQVSGITEVFPINGTAVFDSIFTSEDADGYQLLFTSGLLRATSISFSAYRVESKLVLSKMPWSEVGGTAFQVQPSLNVTDDLGRLHLGSRATLYASVTKNAGLFGQTRVSVVNGVAQFTDLFLLFTGTYQIKFALETSASSLWQVSEPFEIIVGPPAMLLLLQPIAGVLTGGTAFPVQPAVHVADAGGNLANVSVSVTTSLLNSTAKLGGMYRFCTEYRFDGECINMSDSMSTGAVYGLPVSVFSKGALLFTDLNIDRAGRGFVIQFSSIGLKEVNSHPLAISVGPVAKFRIIMQPSGAYTGSSFLMQPVVQTVDAGGNFIPESGVSVTASISKSSISQARWDVMLMGSIKQPTIAGFANFTDLRIDFAAVYCSLSFTAQNIIADESAKFEIGSNIPMAACLDSNPQGLIAQCGPADVRTMSLQISSQPHDTAVGVNFSASLVVSDRLGSIVPYWSTVIAEIKYGTGDGHAILSGSAAMLVNGMVSFPSLVISRAGIDYILTFIAGNMIVESDRFQVASGIPNSIKIQNLTKEWMLNAIFPSISIYILDVGGGLANDSKSCRSISVSLESGPSGIQILGSTVESVIDGSANFTSLVFVSSGRFTLRFSCLPFRSSLSLISENITIWPFGKIAENPIMLIQGPHSIGAVPLFAGSNFDSFRPFEFVTPVVVALRDVSGNIVRNFAGNIIVHLEGTTNYDLSMTATARAGLFTFPVLFFYPFQIPDGTALSPIPSTNESLVFYVDQLGFSLSGKVVVPGIQVTDPLFKLSVDPVGPIIQAGESFSIIVNVLSASDSVPMATFSGVIAVVAVASQSLIGESQILASGSRILIEKLQLNRQEGNVVLNVSASRRFGSQIFSASNVFSVGVGIPRSLTILRQPALCFGGASCQIQPQVQLLDGGENAIALSSVTVFSFAKSLFAFRNGDTLPLNIWSGRSDSLGIVTFTNIAVDISGLYVLIFYGDNLKLRNTSSNAFQVYVGNVTKVTSILSPSNLVTSLPFNPQPVIISSDAGGNWVPWWADSVTAAIVPNCLSDGGCSLSGQKTQMITNGVAFFTDLSVNFAGSFVLRFKLNSKTSCSLLSCWESANKELTVVPGIANQLSIQQWSLEVICAGIALNHTIAIEVHDFAGNLVVSDQSLHIAVRSPFVDSPVSGKTVSSSIAGVAYFTDLVIDRSCSWYAQDPFATCYNLTFASQTLSVVSPDFSVWAGPVAGIGFTTQPSNTVIGVRAGIPAVQYVDALENPVFQVPPGVREYCGSTMPLMTSNITMFATHYYASQNSLVLGTHSTVIKSSSVRFNGISINWGVPSQLCMGTEDNSCSQENISRFRFRALASHGFFVADSDQFSVDVPQPVNVVVSSTNITHVDLIWNAPFYGPAPNSYNLFYRKVGTQIAWTRLSGISRTGCSVGPLDYEVLYEFQICSESILVDGCPIANPVPFFATGVQPVKDLNIVYVDQDSVSLSWNHPPIGNYPPSYRVIGTDSVVGYEIISKDTSGTSLRITGLNSLRAYKFSVHSRAQNGDFFSPQGPLTEWIIPISPPTFVSIMCASDPCNGNSTRLIWSPPPVAPKSYRIRAEQKQNGYTTFDSTVDIRCSSSFKHCNSNSSLMNLTLLGLSKGVPLSIYIFSQSGASVQSYALSAAIYLTPLSIPSAPRDLKLVYEGDGKVRVNWNVPEDLGGGATTIILVTRYILHINDTSTRVVGLNSSLSCIIEETQFGRGYSISLFASVNVTYGEICTSKCVPLTIQLNGSLLRSQFYLGYPPYWDTLHAPVRSDSPTIYNAFVNNLFSFADVTSLGTYIGQTISISVTGLSDCGAKISSIQVGNPARASVYLIPSVNQLGMTFPICFTAKDQYQVPTDTRCIHLYVVRPQPFFIAPKSNISEGPYRAVVGCTFRTSVVAIDLTSGSGITASHAAGKGYKVHIDFLKSITSTSRHSVDNLSLPSGAVFLEDASYFSNPTKRELIWTPLHGHEGLRFDFCFMLTDSLGTVNTASLVSREGFCLSVSVARCRYCLQPGDSLFTISNFWGTNWMNIWAGNGHILRPSHPLAFTEIILGPLFFAQAHDSIDSLGIKLSTSPENILNWNPDLAFYTSNTSMFLDINQEICVLPHTCTP